jgi:thymidylate synthase
MEFAEDSLDAVLFKLYHALEVNGQQNVGSRGKTRELISVTLNIQKPRARLSVSENRGKPFSALGELLWYLSGSNTLEFIKPYVPRYKDDAVNGILEGAYGPRLLNMREGINQFDSIHKLLREKPGSRRAVIQLFNAEDIATVHREIPCTTTMQFHLRNGILHMSVTMRSNDAYWGLPHDVFCFTMIQEMMARRLGAEIGQYHQYVGSMHVYEDFLPSMKEYVEEGFQQTREMPMMPEGNPFDRVGQFLEIERRLRNGESIVAADEIDDSYWADILRLLQAFWARKWVQDYQARLLELKAELACASYAPYLEGRRHLSSQAAKARETHIV